MDREKKEEKQMNHDDLIKSAEHIAVCEHCRMKIASAFAKEIADIATDKMIDILKASNHLIKDDSSIFQAQTCQLLASYFLATSIKIFEINKIPPYVRDKMFKMHIELAKDFSKKATFRTVDTKEVH